MQLHTIDDIPFGLLGNRGAAPAPTVFVFSTTLQESLGNPAYCRVANVLQQYGFLAVSLDLPCHGSDARAGEPENPLSGWRVRLQAGEAMVEAFTSRASRVLDWLVAEQYTDPAHVAACGTSRGGFIALHLAAADPRVRAAVAFAPVVTLPALAEFRGAAHHPAVRALNLTDAAERLCERAIWITIGADDTRVGTDYAITLTRKIVLCGREHGCPADVELHVLPAPGHATPSGAHDAAAAWVLARVG